MPIFYYNTVILYTVVTHKIPQNGLNKKQNHINSLTLKEPNSTQLAYIFTVIKQWLLCFTIQDVAFFDF